MVEQWNSDSGREEQLWWNSGTEVVEQWTNDYGTEQQRWWNSGTVMVEELNRYGVTVEQ